MQGASRGGPAAGQQAGPSETPAVPAGGATGLGSEASHSIVSTGQSGLQLQASGSAFGVDCKYDSFLVHDELSHQLSIPASTP